MTTRLEVSDPSGVGHARRTAAEVARDAGLSDRSAATLALVVTELATNLVKHAGHGEILLDRPASTDRTVDVLSVDRGPGIARLGDALRDSFSTAGSPGLGLGSVGRLATAFDVHTATGAGTVLWARIGVGRAEGPIDVGAVCVAKAGESVAGDAWAVVELPDRVRVMVADGVGHGPEAATAATEAVRLLRTTPDRPLEDLFAALHAQLRPTRGAAIAVADVNLRDGRLRYAGVGNIVGVVAAPSARQHNLVSHPGTVGHELRRVQAFDYPFPPDALLVMHSDGVRARWGVDSYPGLTRRQPSVVAGILYRDFARGTDDATVVTMRAHR